MIALAGFLLSGPVGFILVRWLAPQPPWTGPADFVAHYSWLQDLPFLLGFLLIAGMVTVACGHYFAMPAERRTQALLSFAATGVFASLISFNYVCQTTFVRNLALHYEPGYDPIISAFSMANPLSLAWSVEMWGYAFLGLATWLWAGYYRQMSKLLYRLLTLNGIVSIATAIISVISLDWVMTPAGIAGYMAWNALMIAMMLLLIIKNPPTTAAA